MKILITGANGFIGKNLKNYLKDKHALLTPSSSELDLCNEKAVADYFQKNSIDTIVHCAVVGGSRKEEQAKKALKNNLLIFFNILKYKKPKTKLIHLGSGAEYGKSRSIKNINETAFGVRVPQNDYGLYKFICSQVIENEKNCVNLRLFGVFGKYEDYRYRFISYAICRNIFKLPITINQNVYFDYIYINDLLKIINHFINNVGSHKQYNIGRGEKVDLATIAERINKISQYKSKIIVRKQGLNNEYSCDNSRLMGELGNFNFTNFDKSLLELYNWYELNIGEISRDVFLIKYEEKTHSSYNRSITRYR